MKGRRAGIRLSPSGLPDWRSAPDTDDTKYLHDWDAEPRSPANSSLPKPPHGGGTGGHASWTEAEKDALRAMWLKGLFGREIADQLPGRTRPAILRMARRMGLPPRDNAEYNRLAGLLRRGKPNVRTLQQSG